MLKLLEIIHKIVDEIHESFNKDIIFLFVGGSIARNEYENKSDIDLFTCLKSKDTVEKVREFFIYKCIKNDILIDWEYPGEIMTHNNLTRVLDEYHADLENIINKPRKLYDSNDIFSLFKEENDGCIWSNMLLAKKVFFRGNYIKYSNYRALAEEIYKKIKIIKSLTKQIDPGMKDITQAYCGYIEIKNK